MKKITVTICLILILCSCRDAYHHNLSEYSYKTPRQHEVLKIMRKHWINEIDTGDFYLIPAARRKEYLSELNKMEKDYYYELSDQNMPLTVPGPSWEIRGPLTIDKVKEDLLENIRERTRTRKEDISPETYLSKSKSWTMLKNQYIEGDEIYYYKSDILSWTYLRGRSGYFLIRNNKVIDWIVTVMN